MPTAEQLNKWMVLNGYYGWYISACISAQSEKDMESIIQMIARMDKRNFEQLVNEIKQIKV